MTPRLDATSVRRSAMKLCQALVATICISACVIVSTRTMATQGLAASNPSVILGLPGKRQTVARIVVTATGMARAAKDRLGDTSAAGANANTMPQSNTAIEPAVVTNVDRRRAANATTMKSAARTLAIAGILGAAGEPANPPNISTRKSHRSIV